MTELEKAKKMVEYKFPNYEILEIDEHKTFFAFYVNEIGATLIVPGIPVLCVNKQNFEIKELSYIDNIKTLENGQKVYEKNI